MKKKKVLTNNERQAIYAVLLKQSVNEKLKKILHPKCCSTICSALEYGSKNLETVKKECG